MDNVTIQKTILLCILVCACTCVGCHAQQLVAGEEEPPENPARRDPKNAKLLCLESGDMETLLRISFSKEKDTALK